MGKENSEKKGKEDSGKSFNPASDEIAAVTVAEAMARLSAEEGKRFVTVFSHGSLLVEIYAPRGNDPQKPHTRDEIYVIAQGRGFFVSGEARHPVEPNQFLFAPAGVSHRFEDFTDDLIVWVMFYGPEGGEGGQPAPTPPQ